MLSTIFAGSDTKEPINDLLTGQRTRIIGIEGTRTSTARFIFYELREHIKPNTCTLTAGLGALRILSARLPLDKMVCLILRYEVAKVIDRVQNYLVIATLVGARELSGGHSPG